MFLSYSSDFPTDANGTSVAQNLVDNSAEITSGLLGYVITPPIYSTNISFNNSIVRLETFVNEADAAFMRTLFFIFISMFSLWLLGGFFDETTVIQTATEFFIFTLIFAAFIALLNGFGWYMHKRSEDRVRNLLTRTSNA